jgi:hypothetical protein
MPIIVNSPVRKSNLGFFVVLNEKVLLDQCFISVTVSSDLGIA